MLALSSTRVLLISPKFFGYEVAIKRELEKAGANVDWFNHIPGISPFVKVLIRFRPALLHRACLRHVRNIVAGSRGAEYTFVLMIKGEGFSPACLEELRAAQPKAKYIYYSWDSLRNFSDGVKKLAYFDAVFSFDVRDCRANTNIRHLPLFFTERISSIGNCSPNSRDIDLLFVGSLHADRYAVAERIISSAKAIVPSLRNYCYYFYQDKGVFALRKLLDRNFRPIPVRDVKWEPLSAENVMKLFAKARIVVDVNHPDQTGLTMRTVESLGACRKLITTNASVREYSFFNPNNISVVSRSAPVLEEDFLLQPYVDVPVAVYDEFRLDRWIDKILNSC